MNLSKKKLNDKLDVKLKAAYFFCNHISLNVDSHCYEKNAFVFSTSMQCNLKKKRKRKKRHTRSKYHFVTTLHVK